MWSSQATCTFTSLSDNFLFIFNLIIPRFHICCTYFLQSSLVGQTPVASRVTVFWNQSKHTHLWMSMVIWQGYRHTTIWALLTTLLLPFSQTMFRPWSSLLRPKWKPLNFSNPNFARIPEWQKVEEETLPFYEPTRYYPTRIGEVIKERYQVIGKLGFGSTSTVWLARDMEWESSYFGRQGPTLIYPFASNRSYVALKIFVRAALMYEKNDHEVEMYRLMEKIPSSHPGRGATRTYVNWYTRDQWTSRKT